MNLTDSHTHLYLDEFQPSPDDAVRRAIDSGVTQLLFPNVDLDTIGPMKRLAAAFPDNISMAMGLHPTSVNERWRDDLAAIEEELTGDTHYVAIGEIGIDMYWDKTFRKQQMDVFERQCRIAVERDIPVIIHCREGLPEVTEVFGRLDRVPRGVFHSFGGTAEDVEMIRRYGDFYFGINGIVTFKNSRVAGVLPAIGTDRLLLETDSPYLAPVPHRGKRNESAYIVHTAAYIAAALGITVEEVADITTRNYFSLFGHAPAATNH